MKDELAALAETVEKGKDAAISRRLPLLYRSLYRIRTHNKDGLSLYLAADREEARLTPGMIAAHMKALAELLGNEVIYSKENLSAQDALRLYQRGVSYISLNGNAHLPFWGLRTVRTATPPQEDTKPGCAATILLLAVLQHLLPPILTYETARRVVSCSAGTLHAAMRQLQGCGLFLPNRRHGGRCVELRPSATGRELWDRALPLLPNPCKRALKVELPHELHPLPAGETALSEYSALAAPPTPVYAVTMRDYRKLFPTPPSPWNAAPVSLQLWMYPPNVLGKDRVDPLSLWLTLRHVQDERVQQALEQLINQVPW